MALQCDGGGKDEIKTQFEIRKGVYRLVPHSEYSRPNRVGFNTQTNTSVKVSFVSLPDPSGNGDRICFNVGRELYVYHYKGIKKAADLSKPIEKRTYKGTFPTCHDFNTMNLSADSISLLVGFSAGQIQLIDPIKKELSRLYNEERLIDKTNVTCLKWLPNSQDLFVVSHSSGQLYVYKDGLSCGNTAPQYQLFKQGEGFTVFICKTKTSRNPLYMWSIGEGSLNAFAFSPCSKYLATVSQDGFLRVFDYDTMEPVGMVRSYFGELLCVCWSPDSQFVVVGGEDDLVTVWSLAQRRVVARGQGHKSWISVVAFDPYSTLYADDNGGEINGDTHHNSTSNSENLMKIISYRFGSLGQDTQLCMWDLTEDILKQPIVGRTRTSTLLSSPATNNSTSKPSLPPQQASNNCCPKETTPILDGSLLSTLNLGSSNKSGTEKKSEKEHKRNFSLSSRNSNKNSLNKSLQQQSQQRREDPVKLIGTSLCPRLDEVPMLEPLVCKKLAHERLTDLVFLRDCFVIACQEGYVSTWARPGKE